VADVRPFRAIRYATSPGADVSALTAPPYDVIDAAARASLLARDPHNVVALELPEGALDPAEPDGRYAVAARRWTQWRDDGVLVEDDDPAVYVVEQAYEHRGRTIRRRAFVAAVTLEPFSAGVILPHERTLPKAIADRLEMTRATAANLSQVFGMFADRAGATDAVFEAAMSTDPLARATDDDGVLSTLWALRDPAAIADLTAHLAHERIFIADGHHRYTTALAYRDERRSSSPDSAEEPPAYDSVMMALVNMDDPDLIVYPTHRVADAPAAFDPNAFREALAGHFTVEDAPASDALAALAAAGHTGPAFLVRTRDGVTSLVTLRPDIDHAPAFPPRTSEAWRSLDVAVLQELILDPLLGIHPDRPETLERLSFVKDADAAIAMAGEHDVAFVMNATRMDQLAKVAGGGEIMPQKSTYFYPKLLSGLLFKSLE
jgi:uncharacterized protein (DUF1015 family)